MVDELLVCSNITANLGKPLHRNMPLCTKEKKNRVEVLTGIITKTQAIVI